MQEKQENPLPDNVVHTKIGTTTYEVVSNYKGNFTLLDIIKGAIKRDIENGDY